MKSIKRRKFVIKFFFFTVGLVTSILNLGKVAIASEADAIEREPLPPNDKTKQKNGLSTEAKKILEQNRTEPPFSSQLLYENRKGTYHCAKCDNLIFTSEMKYDSGTGWPSFSESLPGAFKTKIDKSFGMERVEYHCAKCGAHHGHVFNDGPKESGKRFCNNGLCLIFKPE